MMLKCFVGMAAAAVFLDGVAAFHGTLPSPPSFLPSCVPTTIRQTPCQRTHSQKSTGLLQSSLSVESGYDAATADSPNEESTGIRPLHQNWWPVATVDSLKDDRPNQLAALGKPLVTYFEPTSGTWKVLDDMCSHRFAPLSEGRVVPTTAGSNLQCAYHGWEFDCEGTCQRVPQQPNRVDKANPVQSYAVREDLGILWVWMDPETLDSLGRKIKLPINSLLRKCDQANDSAWCFMRDLPYGMEILGENLLDLSHLPYAHHSVSMLKRSLGNELPTRMLSLKERETVAKWEIAYDAGVEPVLPRMQAEIEQAAAHDPFLMPFFNANQPEQFSNWTTHIGFFDPCHVRYTRSFRLGQSTTSTVELFMCPTSEGRSRVFLFNCMDGTLKQPRTLKERVIKSMMKRARRGSKGHMMAHKIFDGDGIFLHKQGNRMKVADLSFKNYSTPASADVLLNSYRRFLDLAAARTRQVGFESVADTVVGMGSYGDDAPRAELLDRYNTHTVHCSICTKDLQKTRKRKTNLQRLETALQGATGSGITAFATLATMRRLSSVAIPGSALGYTALASVLGLAGNALTSKLIQRTEAKINSFLFEDYVHADKN